MANIKVAVRIRPVSERELNVTGGEIIVHTDGTELSLTNLKVSSSKAGDSRKRTRRYGFDYCFNSSSIQSEAHATQEKVYETLGKTALDALFSGFNACLVAYGQSASGKTYTMMGPKNEPGLTPRLCEGLFLRISEEEKKSGSYEISISYLEIYNERVRDLLKPSTNSRGLRVREHPRLGPYVQGLTCQSVSTLSSLMSYVDEGTRARKKASTLQNPTSSRSHALLTVSLNLRSENSTTGQENKQQHLPRGAKLHLVDLAGSERAGNSNYGLHRLKEGANINKSLVALGNVISALAERGATGSGPGRRFIPYRDSSLTWLLKDALGGNATTIMLATISPASGSYNETAHTLRFAHRAQSVVNRPVVNEDPVSRVIRELRAEISRLTLLLSEKEIDGERNSSCCCKCEKDRVIGVEKFEGGNSKWNLHRRSNSDEGISSPKCQVNEDSIPLRKFGSLRSLDGSEVDLSKENISCEEVRTLASVDIPTLVAVLIKPEVDESGATLQIEEISGETILEDTVEETFDLPDFEEEENKIVAVINDEEIVNPDTEDSVLSVRKDGNDEEVSSNWKKIDEREDDLLVNKKCSSLKIISKKFGSSESIECLKKRETHGGLIRRSYTNLQLVRGDKNRSSKVKRNWIPKGSTPTSSKKPESSVEKDSQKKLTSKDVSTVNQSKTSSTSRGKFQDSESPKRKFSRDSSSSGGAKDEISSTPPSKQLRKSSVSSETSSRTQTPIQRTNRRAKIVAAVTERLYSTKKSGEETTANNQSPEFRSPDSTEFKLANATRMRLQEISRKMLARRRKTCVETQTDVTSTVRVKDMGSITDDFRVATKEVAVVTDLQENCCQTYSGSSVTRVKEMATLTENFSKTVRLRDVEVLTEDCGEDMSSTEDKFDKEIVNSFERREGISFIESSTNTTTENLKSTSSGSQTLEEDENLLCKGLNKNLQESYQLSTSNCPERNVICITVPDMLSITIESPNTLESKIAITERPASGTADDKLLASRMRDGETQTEDPEKPTGSKNSESNVMIEDSSATVTTRSAGCQSDGRTFRIENIFKDPKNETRIVDRNVAFELLPDLTEQVEIQHPNKVSLKLTNSVGTSFTPETMERSTEIERANFIDFKTKEMSRLKFRGEDLNLIENPCRNIPLGEDFPQFFCLDQVRGSCDKNCSTKSRYRINSFVENPSETKKVSKIEAEDLKSPLLVAKMLANSCVEIESNNFSDDSLDPEEENPSKILHSRLDDSLCPPDVVAHTKKEIYESRVDDEDFENETVPEFPRSSLPPEGETTRAYDYESLILGKRIFTPVNHELEERNGNDTPESEDGIINRSKKKVSFSNSKPPERRISNDDTKRPKPIIKNAFLLFDEKNVSEEVSDAPKLLQEYSTSENSFSRDDEASSISGSSETVRSVGLYNSEDDSDDGRSGGKREEESEMKRVRFKTFLPNEGEGSGESVTSDSDCCNEESFCCDIKREVFASYLDAATDFVHNMNTANFDRFIGNKEKDFNVDDDDDDDYIEYRGRRISLRDDTDEYLKEDTFDVPVDSYRDCLRGIDKLEKCISRAVSNDKFIIDKYGLIGLESSATSIGLVDPGEDSNRLGSLTENFPGVSSRLGNSFINDSTPRVQEDSSDMEASIFQQLIESSTPIKRTSACGKPYFRRSTRMSDLSGRTQASYSRLRRRQGPANLRKAVTPPLPEEKKSNFHLTPSQDSLLKAPQCFLLVPDLGKPSSSSSREYRSDGGTSSSEQVCTSSESIDTSSPSARSKLRYPGSPRAKLLQLVTERRQIVHRSRNPSPSQMKEQFF